jgi:hypothetical protein
MATAVLRTPLVSENRLLGLLRRLKVQVCPTSGSTQVKLPTVAPATPSDTVVPDKEIDVGGSLTFVWWARQAKRTRTPSPH